MPLLQHSQLIFRIRVVILIQPQHDGGYVKDRPIPTASHGADFKSAPPIRVRASVEIEAPNGGRPRNIQNSCSDVRITGRVIRQSSASLSDLSKHALHNSDSGNRQFTAPASPPSQREPESSRWNGASRFRLQTRTLGPAPAAERLPLSAGRLPSLASVESGPRATRDAILSAC